MEKSIILNMKAAFPGSFDPVSYGHLNIIQRAQTVFDELLVIVAENRQKRYLFSTEERVAMAKEAVKSWKNVSVVPCDKLLMEFMRDKGIHILVRGVRGTLDFSFEYDLALLYKSQDHIIDSFFLPADPAFSVCRSSFIREIASFKGDVSAMVPPFVAQALKSKYE